jgi:hypothetical protein
LEDPRDLYPKNWIKNPTIWESQESDSEQSVDKTPQEVVEEGQ